MSNDLYAWPGAAIDTAAISVRAGMFDSKHVWAPSIVRRGLTYYMFYTGVDDAGHQRIGPATSTDLVTWERQSEPVLRYEALGDWAMPRKPGPPYFDQAQLRDPFVMPDPDNPGQWLMYFITIPTLYPDATVVGVARSNGDFTEWTNDFPLMATLHPLPAPGQALVESPHAFYYQGRWWLLYHANQTTVFGISNPASPTDEVAANWTAPQELNALVVDEYTGQPSNAYGYWHATEFLEVAAQRDASFLAAFNDQAIGISYIMVGTAVQPYLFEERCDVIGTSVDEGPREGPDPDVRLTRIGTQRMPVELRAELPSASHARLEMFDVAGRRLRTLLDGVLPAGSSYVTWDGLDDSGRPAGSGVYFASLRAAGSLRAVRVALVR